MNYTGEIAALCVALFWTITALAFEQASIKVGSLMVNIIRLFIGFLFLSTFAYFYRGMFFPTDASVSNWLWLILSGLIGFVFGDLFLLKSFTLIGSRFAMLIMTMVPPITAFVGWIILGEKLSILNLFGMLLTVGGISVAVFNRNTESGKITLKVSMKGILFALFGALGQAVGLVISKLGMNNYDPFASTQIRLIAGMGGFTILVSLMGRWSKVSEVFKSGRGLAGITIGSFFGPFLGVSFSLLAVKYTQAGIASTIMSIVPILIIPPAIILYKERVTFFEVAGAVLSFVGVSIFFL